MSWSHFSFFDLYHIEYSISHGGSGGLKSAHKIVFFFLMCLRLPGVNKPLHLKLLSIYLLIIWFSSIIINILALLNWLIHVLEHHIIYLLRLLRIGHITIKGILYLHNITKSNCAELKEKVVLFYTIFLFSQEYMREREERS